MICRRDQTKCAISCVSLDTKIVSSVTLVLMRRHTIKGRLKACYLIFSKSIIGQEGMAHVFRNRYTDAGATLSRRDDLDR